MAGQDGPLGKEFGACKASWCRHVFFEDRLWDLTPKVEILSFVIWLVARHYRFANFLMLQFYLLQNRDDSWTFLLELV